MTSFANQGPTSAFAAPPRFDAVHGVEHRRELRQLRVRPGDCRQALRRGIPGGVPRHRRLGPQARRAGDRTADEGARGHGAAWGAVFGFFGHAATRGARDFASARTLVATRYDIVGREGHADAARSALRSARLRTVA